MEHEECQLEAKDGKGCREWWLMDVAPTPAREVPIEEDADDSKGIHGAGAEG
ncbi:MAG: hypothetical protein J6Y15_05025 [Bacteroidaceae bacterium]|nr:hypothetical protein [Bacteroidaceae bacterium]